MPFDCERCHLTDVPEKEHSNVFMCLITALNTGKASLSREAALALKLAEAEEKLRKCENSTKKNAINNGVLFGSPGDGEMRFDNNHED